ncbi:F1 capsule-anchoring protein precursor [Serratia liquefaciens]|uniref:fimbria/pilus outer membrane usher protein n=1 Tax=Serratia liquefaciens TaxID=614 RepID=UPI002177975C|nr:fimbria/pilus outer membrane usher protein [Serratia liquefaciens]CAI1991281.1 F1 capsule-anchoring protein precursor [Serratia liquefaciens]HDS8360558.1 fimbria/pilus outer membrane usher protein [Serratia liquefaciens]
MRHDDHVNVWPTLSVLSLALLAALATTSPVLAAVPDERADDVEFDHQAMLARGIDPKLAEWFRQSPRFLPGESTVTLTINGNARGKVKVRFDQSGKLCADEAFQKEAGLISPPGYSKKIACFDLKTAWPQTEVNLEPGEARVDVVLPPEAVIAPDADRGSWNHGGFAGMLNYDAQYMDSAGASAGTNFMQLGTEAGFNISDWIVRSQQTFSRFNGKDQMQHQAAYAQRTFSGIKKVFQAGQVSLSNSMFGTGQVLGLQVFPEAALQSSRGGAGLVEGIADSQSVVEVRQSGVLVYSTTVPAGPFRLQGFSLLNTRSDLLVTVTGGNGEKRQFSVPASTLLMNGPAVAPGMSFGIGKLDQQGSSEAPLIGTLANGWVLNPYTALNAGLLGSSPYRAAAVGVDSQLFDVTFLSMQTTAAQDDTHGNKGLSATAVLSHKLTERIGVSVNAVQQTSGYRDLSDALQTDSLDTAGRNRNQYGGGISWSLASLGNLSLSWARSSTFAGDATNYVRGGWSKQFNRVYLGATLDHDTGSRNSDAETRLYITVNIPFGDSRSISSYLNNSSRNGSRGGMRYSDRGQQDGGWSLSSERDFRNRRTSATGSIDKVTPVSQLSGSISQDSDNYTSWSARASGAIVAHPHGITLSPYRVNDTFGIAKVGEEAGVRLDSPAGPIWTDGRGYAVLPSLSGYKRSAIQVDTRSLAKNVDISNAWQETEAARGSVSYVDFHVIRTRRVLVDVKDVENKPLPYGASVFDAAGNFVTVVGNKGSVFISDAAESNKLDVQVSGKTICSFPLSLPAQAGTSGLYETADAVCR